MFSDIPLKYEFKTADEVLADYIKTHSPVSIPESGRIISEYYDDYVEAAA